MEECSPFVLLPELSELDRSGRLDAPTNEQQVVSRGLIERESDRLRHPAIDVVMTLTVAKARSKSSSGDDW
jgi:hypothetical protein